LFFDRGDEFLLSVGRRLHSHSCRDLEFGNAEFVCEKGAHCNVREHGKQRPECMHTQGTRKTIRPPARSETAQFSENVIRINCVKCADSDERRQNRGLQSMPSPEAT
jgi:hypothetical protein